MLLQRPLKTERLILDTLGESHVNETYLGWVTDPETTRYLEIRFADFTVENLRDFVTDMNASADNLLLGMFLKDGGRHIGNIKLGPVIAEHKRADIGLIVGDKASWGQGFATEAIDAVAGHALNGLGLHRVTAGCYSENIGSYKAFLKCGFVEDGRLKDYWLCEGAWQDEIVMHKLAENGHD